MNNASGTILRVYNTLYDVAIDGEISPKVCHKKKMVPKIYPGDKVDLEIDEHQANIVRLQPRVNLIPHPRVANVDRVMFMVAAAQPAPDLWVVDQFLHYWQIQNIPLTLIVNKSDLLDDSTRAFFQHYEGLGVSMIFVEALHMRPEWVKSLLVLISNKTVMFAGQSGVGKSTLLRALVPESMALTGEVSKKLERGRQTTKQASLHYWSEAHAQIVDTPGFSMVDDALFTMESTQQFYSDVLMSSSRCRFPDCSHIKEPDCAVKQALQSNTILEFRYKHYVKTLALLDKNKKW